MLYKKELLTIEVPKARKIPRSFIASYKIYGEVYSGAAVCADLPRCGKVLCIDIFNVNKEHKLRFFTDRNNYITYDIAAQKWIKRKISRDALYTSPCYSTDKSVNIATVFLRKNRYSNTTLISLADDFISEQMSEQRYRAKENREMRIEQDMKLFKALPKGIDDFVYDTVFPNHIVVGKINGNKRPAQCARCGHKFTINKECRHRDKYVCPKCGRTSTLYEARYINEYKTIKASNVVFAAQTIKDAILYRWFKTTLCLYKDGTQKIIYDDDEREVIRGDKVKTYYFKNLGWYLGAKWRESKYGRHDEIAYIFPGGLEDAFPEPINNIYIPELVKNFGGMMMLPTLVKNLQLYPQTEYLVKLGLIRFASEFSAYGNSDGTDWDSVVGISKGYLPLLKKYDVSGQELRCMQASRTHISEESFVKFRNLSAHCYVDIELVTHFLETMSFERFVNYFSKVKKRHKNLSFTHIAQWYADYVNMSEALEIDLSHKSVRYPVELKEAHDRLAKRFESVRSEIEQKTFEAATRKLKTQVHDFHRNGFMVTLPTCEADFVKEGQSLSHCVGNGTYFKEHMKGENIIVFIRKEKEPDTPFVTMQINLKKLLIRQIYGYKDKAPAVEVRRFAEAFVKSLKKSAPVAKTA